MGPFLILLQAHFEAQSSSSNSPNPSPRQGLNRSSSLACFTSSTDGPNVFFFSRGPLAWWPSIPSVLHCTLRVHAFFFMNNGLSCRPYSSTKSPSLHDPHPREAASSSLATCPARIAATPSHQPTFHHARPATRRLDCCSTPTTAHCLEPHTATPAIQRTSLQTSGRLHTPTGLPLPRATASNSRYLRLQLGLSLPHAQLFLPCVTPVTLLRQLCSHQPRASRGHAIPTSCSSSSASTSPPCSHVKLPLLGIKKEEEKKNGLAREVKKRSTKKEGIWQLKKK